MDRSWMRMDRRSEAYDKGVTSFIEFARNNSPSWEESLRCPCLKCGNLRILNVVEVKEHLFWNGIDASYDRWIWHGEAPRCESSIGWGTSSRVNFNDDSNVEEDIECDRMEDLVRDVEDDFPHESSKFEDLLEGARKPLYEDCSKFTQLSAVVRLFNLKAANGWSDKSFSDNLKLIKEMLPSPNNLPGSLYEAKKILGSLGMQYEKISACPNDCILYRNEFKQLNECPECGKSRWKMCADGVTEKHGVPAKVMWYLSPIPRFVRLFMSKEHAKNLTWHADGEGRVRDRMLRHAADSPQWKSLDINYPDFARDPRNLRLGLCTDGFNPHSVQSSQHSCWPVLLSIYNLPPDLCMKRKFIMLSLLIPGPKQPGDKLDVYLAPLVDDLKKLWVEGVETYDAHRCETFSLRAALMWTVNDYPAYGNIAGCVVKGYWACVICGDQTSATYLHNGHKLCYMCHRKWLPKNHPFRKKRKAFNGQVDLDSGPRPITGNELVQLLDSLDYDDPLTKCWKRKSILFELEYWETLHVRHNLDVMHIEKNVCESIIGTLLNIPGKSKDSKSARLDMVDMGIRPELAPIVRNNREFLPPACYTFRKEEKRRFCKTLYELKVPDGYSSNIKSRVSLKDSKLINLKSHDCHILMQQLLPVAIRGSLDVRLRHAIMRLCFFFNSVCARVVDPVKLDTLQCGLIETICELEMFFPPSFFDIMVHLSIHLVREIKLCGPVFLRWMYPFERFMKILKGYVRNRYRPEACMVENYIAEEAIEFCTEYLCGVSPIGVPIDRNVTDKYGRSISSGKCLVVDFNLLRQAHLYVLRNTAIVDPYIQEHMNQLKQENPSRARDNIWIQNKHIREFPKWFESHIAALVDRPEGVNLDPLLRYVSRTPNQTVIGHDGYIINGYRFFTKDRDNIRVVQNSGVSLVAHTMQISSAKDKNPHIGDLSYYGVIEEIWELDYIKFHIPVFKCKWVDSNGGVTVDDVGFTLVNLNRIGHKDDCFILASQAKQVFYVADPSDPQWSVVLNNNPRSSEGDDNNHVEMFGFTRGMPPLVYDQSDEVPNYLLQGEAEIEITKTKRKRAKWLELL